MNNKPNIIYVITDQHRKNAMGFWSKDEYKDKMKGVGDPVITPNMDNFADESVVFTQAISNCPLCSPYRGMLLSGRYPENNGVSFNCKAGRTSSLREDIKCFTDVLSESGYNIGYLGKYHLDMPQMDFDKDGNYVGESGEYYIDGSVYSAESCWDTATPAGPKRHSVDYWYLYGTLDVHKNPRYFDNNCVRHEPKEWSPKHEADEAISYIYNAKNQRDENNPFCLFVAMNPPHGPYNSIDDTDEEIFDKYYSEDKIKDVNTLLNRPNIQPGAREQESVRYYFSHVTGVDRQFGRILDAIDQRGIKDNTIVVYSADHGEMMGSHGLMGKNVAYEESYLIPLLIRYPKQLKHKCEDLMINGPDIMPTLLSLAGLKDATPKDIDGVDYSYILTENEEKVIEKPKSSLFIHHYDEYQRKGVRTNKYTFVIEKTAKGDLKKVMLFDNENDIYQLNNLELDDIPKEDLDFLRVELGKWLKKSNDLWYKQNVFSDFIIYPK